MGRSKGGRRDRGLADMSQVVIAREDDPRWSPDPEAPVDLYPLEMPIAGLGRIKGRQTLDRDTGRIVEFSITAQIERGGIWHDIARVDTCHEEVHLHILCRRTGKDIARRVLRVIRSPQDVDQGFEEGVTILTEDWEEHERRWTRGR